MRRDPREKLLTLVNRATSPTDQDDQEARTAAVQACKLLTRHPELVATPFAADADKTMPAPDWAAAISAIHPDALRLREWRTTLKQKQLREGHATTPTLCAFCGLTVSQGEPVVERQCEGLSTHLACAAWWWKFEPPRAVDYDIAS